MGLSYQSLANAMLHEKKYLLRYHKHHDFLFPFVLTTIIEVEDVFNRLPPLQVTKEELFKYEEDFHSFIRKIAGFSCSIALDTIKEGFANNDFYTQYTKEEREKLAHYIFQEQKNNFQEILNLAIDECTKEFSSTFHLYFQGYLKPSIFRLLIDLFQHTFVITIISEPKPFKQEPIYTK
ncbi:hypothetical protein [Tepidibacillus sp. HK-1]|uniref:hypothetical protein n=1 Tax=Tepidibacillus sp. HK-1 TaxID=1883407 RepID=UPI00085295BE|nr:hypothetical protein [Tepidibacillus sp. HK-1]GBF10405.1 hypothetical protein HK1_00417 [Tepidibacillus sp. HK-1]